MPQKAVPEEKIPVAVPEKSEPPSDRGTCYDEYMKNTSNLLLLSVILTSFVLSVISNLRF